MVHEKPINSGGLPKKGEPGQFAGLRRGGLASKRGEYFLEGG